jgi:sialate O-acetylesterase
MSAPSPATALRLPAIFTEHLVLRADKANPIWGWAPPGTDVSITFQGKISTAKADAQGRWRSELAPAPAGGPYTLEVSGAGQTISFKDVLAGEVWICSGQSNMEWTMSQIGTPEAETVGDFPQIRFFNVPRVARAIPQDDVACEWAIPTPELAKRFSAVGYFFGRDIHQKRNVPVGLISSSWGGTPAEAWTEWSFLQDEPAFDSFIEPYKKFTIASPDKWEANNNLVLEWKSVERHQDPGNRAFFWGWAEDDIDEKPWEPFAAPGLWKEPDNRHRGAVWFRRKITVPKEWAGRDLMLSLGALHDYDTTYFNGEKVGGMGKTDHDAWCTPRYYRIPAAKVRFGASNTIVTRVFNEYDIGGFTGGGPLALYPADLTPDDGLSLTGEWLKRVEYGFDATLPPRVAELINGPNFQNSPSNLYNAMIAPLAPYGVSGTIWYQGESNAERAEQYKPLFHQLIKSWRKQFAFEEMPFLFVLLANYRAPQGAPVEVGGWGEIREAQLHALQLPHTGVASAIDVGDAADIHPKDKLTVGRRLALVARAIVHGEKLVYCGPTLQTAKPEGNRVRLLFNHTGSGIVTRDGAAPAGFAIRAADGKWYWADITIDGDAVIVSHKNVAKPAEVRYAWATNPIGNLANKEGLPMQPFRVSL